MQRLSNRAKAKLLGNTSWPAKDGGDIDNAMPSIMHVRAVICSVVFKDVHDGPQQRINAVQGT